MASSPLNRLGDIQKGGEHGLAILAGDSKSSRLIRMLTGKAEPAMPPEDNVAPSEAEIELLKSVGRCRRERSRMALSRIEPF